MCSFWWDVVPTRSGIVRGLTPLLVLGATAPSKGKVCGSRHPIVPKLWVDMWTLPAGPCDTRSRSGFAILPGSYRESVARVR